MLKKTNFIFKYIALITGVILALSCSKELTDLIQQTFPFQLIENHSSGDTYLFEKRKLNIEIKPQRVVEGQTYEYYYKVVEGDGYFQNSSGETIAQNQKIIVTNEELKFDLYFYPKKEGTNKILLTAINQEREFEEVEIVFDAKKAPFKVAINFPDETYLNEKAPILLNVVRQHSELDKEKNYSFSYFLEEGEGFLYKKEGDIKLQLDNEVNINEGETNLYYIPKTVGKHLIKLKIVAKDGNLIEKVIEINVINIPWDFYIKAPSTTMSVGVPNAIKIVISEDFLIDNQFKLSYSISEGVDAKVVNTVDSSLDLVNDSFIEYLVNQDKNYAIHSNEEGKSKIIFTLKDKNNQIKKDSLIIDFNNLSYKFTYSLSNNKVLINSPIAFSLDLESEIENEYQVKYNISSGNGNLKDVTNTSLIQNNYYPINSGRSVFSYTPYLEGLNQLDFISKDKNGTTSSLSVKIEVYENNITFIVQPSKNQMLLGETNRIGIDLLKENDNETTYQIAYFILGGQGKLKKGEDLIETSQFYEIEQGHSDILFIPETEGIYDIIIKLKNNLGKIYERKISIVVSKTNWKFEAYTNKNNYSPSDLITINGNISSPIDKDFEVKFTSNLNVSLEYNGETYSQGQSFIVQRGNFEAQLKTEEEGDYEVKLIAKLDLETKETNLLYNVSEKNKNLPDFTISGTPTKNEINVNEKAGINIELTDETSTINESYKIKYILEGVNGSLLNSSNITIEPGIFKEITEGVSKWNFIPSTAGQATLKIIIANSEGIEKTTQVKIDVIKTEKDFSFTAIKAKTSELVNNPIAININLDGPTSEGETYKMYFATNRAGYLKLNSDKYTAGEAINIAPSSSSVNTEFIGEETGTYSIDIFIESSFGITKKETISLNFNSVKYDLTITKEKSSLKIGEETFVNININEYVGTSTYTIKYVPVGVALELYDENNIKLNPGANFSIGVNNTRWKVKATEEGEISIDFTVTNTTGEIKSKNITIDVSEPQWTFSSFANQSNYQTTDPVNITSNIISDTNENFNITYESNLNGTLSYNGQMYSQGQNFSTSKGEFIVTFKPTQKGDYQIKLFATNIVTNVTKEVIIKFNVDDTITNNDFTISSTPTKNEININETAGINIELTDQTPTNNENYKIKYILEGVNGTVLNSSNTTIEPGIFKEITEGVSKWNFSPSTAGQATFKIIIANPQGIEKTTQVKIDVLKTEKDFSFTAIKAKTSELVNNPIAININLDGPTSEGETYKMYFATNRAGYLKLNSDKYTAGETINVTPSTTKAEFIGEESGTYSIDIFIESSFGVTKKESITLSFNTVKYDLTVTKDKSTMIVDDEMYVNININEYVGTSTYTIKYVPVGVALELYDDNNIKVIPGTDYSISVNNTRWKVKATEVGEISIDFTVANTTGEIKSKNITIDVLQKDYQLTATPEKSSGVIETTIPINIRIKELDTGGETYQLYFESDKDGLLIYNGTEYRAGQRFNVPVNSSTIYYKGKEKGRHNLTIKSEASTLVKKEQPIALNFNEKDYKLSVTPQKTSIFIDETINLNIGINEILGTSTIYKLKYINNSTTNTDIFDSKDVLVPAGSFIDLTNKNLVWKMKGVTEGKVQLEFIAINEDNTERKVSLAIPVSKKNFTFDVNAGSNSYVNNNVNVNVDLSEEIPTGDTFQIYWTSSLSGEIYKSGTKYVSGTNYPIQLGATSFVYKGLEQGTHEILMTVLSSSGVKKEVQFNVVFNTVDFNFTATPENNSVVQGTTTGINFEIVEIGGASTYEMKYEFDNTTGAGIIKNENGNTITPGIYTTLSSNNFRWAYQNTGLGTASITFTIRNTTLNQKVQNVKISIEEKDFNVNVTSSQTNTYVNETINITSLIDEVIGNSSNYTLKYNSNKSNSMTFNGNPLNQNTTVNVSPETNYIFKYTGKEKGLHLVTFTATSDTGKSKTGSITINYDVLDVEFTATARDNTPILITQTKPIDFVITETGGTQNYEMKYTLTSSTGSGDLIDNRGGSFQKNTYFNVSGSSFTYNFKPTTNGRVTLTFTIRGADGVERTATRSVVIDVEKREYNISATADQTSTYINQTLPIRYNINEVGQTGFDYSLTFNNGGKQGKLIYAGVEYSEGQTINLGANTSGALSYKGNEVGDHNISLSFKADWDTSSGKTVTLAPLKFQLIDFNFNLISPTPTTTDFVLTNHTFVYTINIQPTVSVNSKYYLKNLKIYTSGNIQVPVFTITYNGIDYSSTNLPDLELNTGNNEFQILVNNYNKSSQYKLKLSGNLSNEFGVTKDINSRNSSTTYVNFREFLNFNNRSLVLQWEDINVGGCSDNYCMKYSLYFNNNEFAYTNPTNLSNYKLIAYRYDSSTPKTIIKKMSFTELINNRFLILERRFRYDKVASVRNAEIYYTTQVDINFHLEVVDLSGKKVFDSRDFNTTPFVPSKI